MLYENHINNSSLKCPIRFLFIFLVSLGLCSLPFIFFGLLNIGVHVLSNREGYIESNFPCKVYQLTNYSLKCSYWSSLYESFLFSLIIIFGITISIFIMSCCIVILKFLFNRSLRET